MGFAFYSTIIHKINTSHKNIIYYLYFNAWDAGSKPKLQWKETCPRQILYFEEYIFKAIKFKMGIILDWFFDDVEVWENPHKLAFILGKLSCEIIVYLFMWFWVMFFQYCASMTYFTTANNRFCWFVFQLVNFLTLHLCTYRLQCIRFHFLM